MKTIGIIGGLSPESTKEYYDGLNAGVEKRLREHHSAKALIASVDFGEAVAFKKKGDWDSLAKMLSAAATNLEKAGADFIVLSANTMHKVADQIEASINVPFLHLADTTADTILQKNISKVGLLGTCYTMELDFYKQRLIDKGIEVLIPNDNDRTVVNSVIYDELCHGEVKSESRQKYKDIIADLVERGAEGVIMGCTEITMLIDQSDSAVPLFDTTKIHVERALEVIFDEDQYSKCSEAA